MSDLHNLSTENLIARGVRYTVFRYRYTLMNCFSGEARCGLLFRFIFLYIVFWPLYHKQRPLFEFYVICCTSVSFTVAITYNYCEPHRWNYVGRVIWMCENM